MDFVESWGFERREKYGGCGGRETGSHVLMGVSVRVSEWCIEVDRG